MPIACALLQNNITSDPDDYAAMVRVGWASRPPARADGEDLVQDIVRDGARAGITVVVAGERELVTARFFAAVPNRIFLPAGSTEEGRLAWPRLPVTEAVAGRVVVFGPMSAASCPFSPRSARTCSFPRPCRATCSAS